MRPEGTFDAFNFMFWVITLGACMVRLMKFDVTPRRGFDREALVVPNVAFDERFKFFIVPDWEG